MLGEKISGSSNQKSGPNKQKFYFLQTKYQYDKFICAIITLIKNDGKQCNVTRSTRSLLPRNATTNILSFCNSHKRVCTHTHTHT